MCTFFVFYVIFEQGNDMKNFYTRVINQEDKKLNFFNQNFCYIATILIIVIVIVLNSALGTKLEEITMSNNFWNCFLVSLYPNYSMIMFAAVSLYLERKYGSVKYLALILVCIPISNVIAFAFSALEGDVVTWGGRGFSCVSFITTGIFLMDFLLSIKYHLKNKLSFIFPIVITIVCILFMCINLPDGTSQYVHFDFPGRLLLNSGHYGPFACGVAMRLLGYVFDNKTY